ncbi:cystatin-like isoform X2 [Heterodontus francisci]|uniref:cystatin-like isoform X2 n=1 Tax=Heterodontus francisci TaxID=7792 RepID=UPI00355C8258
MAGWQCLFAIFSIALISVSAFPPHSVKESQQIAPSSGDIPLVLKVDANDKGFQAIAQLALQEFSHNSGYIYQVIQFLTAKVQMFEGSMYIFDVLLGKTGCQVTKNGQQAENCQVIQVPTGQSMTYLCHFIVWKDPSSENQKVLSNDCQKLNL